MTQALIVNLLGGSVYVGGFEKTINVRGKGEFIYHHAWDNPEKGDCWKGVLVRGRRTPDGIDYVGFFDLLTKYKVRKVIREAENNPYLKIIFA